MKNMIKLCCSSQSFDREISGGKHDLFSFADFLADEAGIRYIEIEDKHLQSTDIAYLKELSAHFKNKRLAVANIAFFNSFGYPLKEQNDAEVERAKIYMRAAAALSCPNFRIFAGWTGGPYQYISDAASALPKTEAAWRGMVLCAQKTCDTAKEYGLNIVIENHNPGGFLSSSIDVLRFSGEIGRDSISLLLDTGNYTDGIEGVKKTVHLAKKHIHLKIGNVTEDGSDEKHDIPAILDVISKAGFSGTLSIEYEGTQEEKKAVLRISRFVKSILGDAR